MSANLWNNSCYWSSSPSSRKKELADVTIRFICFKREKEVRFNFCKYHVQAVEVFKRLPNNEKLFDEIKSNCYAVLKLWCFAVKQFEKTKTRLNNYVKTELEFVSHNSSSSPTPQSWVKVGRGAGELLRSRGEAFSSAPLPLRPSAGHHAKFVWRSTSQIANPLLLTPALKTRGVAKC